ncbi:hypothetical protein RSAG8_02514, partial [Rhizoctonia solani AG-8 WAC10335]
MPTSIISTSTLINNSSFLNEEDQEVGSSQENPTRLIQKKEHEYEADLGQSKWREIRITGTSSLEVVNTTEGIAQAISQFSLEFREYQKNQDLQWAELYSCLDKIESIATEARDASLDRAEAPPSPETIKGKAKEEQQPPPTRSSVPTYDLPKVQPIRFTPHSRSPSPMVRATRYSRVWSNSPPAARAPSPAPATNTIKLKAPEILKSTKA